MIADGYPQIQRFLAYLSRRLRLLLVLRLTALYLSGFSAVLLVLMLAASAFDEQQMLRGLGAVATVLLLGFYSASLVHTLRSGRAPRELARRIGQLRPSLSSDVLSCVELADAPASGIGGYSLDLYQGLVRSTWERLHALPLSQIAPLSILRRAAIAITCATLLWSVVAAGLSDAIGRGADRLFVNDFRAETRAAFVLVGDIVLSYSYPQHMNRQTRLVSGSTGLISAPRGTRVDLRAAAMVPADAAALVLKGHAAAPDVRVNMTVAREREVRTSFALEHGGTYHFELRLSDGRVLRDQEDHPITVEPDNSPTVTLFGPQQDTEVTAKHVLELGYRAEDDYGLVQCELVYQAGSQKPKRLVLERPPPRGTERRSVSGRYDWQLADALLEPGVTLTYWIEATDNDRISGPKVGRSAPRRLRVHSPDAAHNRTIEQQDHALELGLRVLSSRLLSADENGEPIADDALVERFKRQNQESSDLTDALTQLRNVMQKDARVSQLAMQATTAAANRLRLLVASERSLLTAWEARERPLTARMTTQQLGRLRAHNAKIVVALEDTVVELSNRLNEQKLQGLVELSREIADGRKRLAQLLEEYKKTGSEATRRALLDQIRALERRVEQLLERAAALNTQISDEYLNPDALKSVNLGHSLANLYQQVQQGRIDQAEAALRELERKLGDMDRLLGGSMQEFRSGRMQAEEKAYSELADNLKGLEQAQRGLAKETEGVVGRYHRRAAETMKRTIRPFARAEQEKAKALKRKLAEVPRKPLAPYDQEQLDRIRQRAQDLLGMLEQQDIAQALQMAIETQNGLELLQDDLSEEVEGRYAEMRRKTQRALRVVSVARKMAAEIAADLKQVLPAPQSILDESDRQRLRTMRKQQANLKRRMDELKKRMQRASDGPEQQLLEQLGSGFKEVGGLMEGAKRTLGKLQAQEAHSSQQAAAERLSQMQRKLAAARAPRRSWLPSPRLPPERIDIPDADAFRPPKEFRQDLLEAMKEHPPAAFRREVERYYHELVR